MRWRFRTWRPVQRGLVGMDCTVFSTQRRPSRCGFRVVSAPDGQGLPVSLRARVMRAMLCPAGRWAKSGAMAANWLP